MRGRLVLVLLSLTLLLGTVSAGFGSIFSWERCPINSTALNQVVIRERLQAHDLRHSPPILGIVEQHLALDAAPYLIARLPQDLKFLIDDSEQFNSKAPVQPLVLTFFGSPGLGKTVSFLFWDLDHSADL